MTILNCPTDPKGIMVIPKALADARINNYLTEKYPILSAIIGREEIKHTYYTVAQLSDLFYQIDKAISIDKLDGIRIYFAVYEAEGVAELLIPIDKSFEGHLTFVFAPTIAQGNDHVDTKDYYYIDQLGGSVVKLSSETATKWMDSYKNNRLNKLSAALGRGDTSSMWIDKASVIDYICYARVKQPTGVFFNLAAYNKDEVIEPSKAFVGSQLTVTFRLSYNTGNDVFAKSLNEPAADGDDADTLTPCPPLTCPPDDL